VFERSEAPFPRLWARGPAPLPCPGHFCCDRLRSVLMFLLWLLFLTVGFC